MENTCLNCSRPITENFCGNCGQKKFKRIDKKYLIDELQYSVIHTNKGFFYSIKNIIKNPGKTARDFIDGDRINHYKPISLAFILSGISAFISYKVLGLNGIMKSYYIGKNVSDSLGGDIIAFLTSYNSAIMLLLIPVISLFTKVAFRKWGQNYYEHIVMNAYIQNFFTIISILLSYPILYLLRNDPGNFMLAANSLSFIIIIFSMIWFYKEFYKEKSMTSIILKILLVFLMLFVSYIVFIFAAVVVYVIIKGPESLKYLQQGKSS